jgi:hypothetical protein
MAELAPLEFFLIVQRPATIFAGRVNGAPTDPYMDITYDGVTVSEGPVAGQTVWFGTTAGGRERGILRLRTTSIATGTSSGTLSVAESDDVGPQIADDDHLTIKEDFRLWPIYPRAVQISDVDAVMYEDWDVAWTDQTVDWRPVAVAGPPAVGELEAGSCALSFFGDRSFALAPAATLDTHLWTADGSVEGTSASQGTTGTPVTFTWNAAGDYLISLQETDSNANSHTNYTRAFVIDPANIEDIAYIDFDSYGDHGSIQSGGWECSFTVKSDCEIADFPEGALVLLVARGDQTTPTASWPYRENVLFAGYIQGDSIRQNPHTGYVSFRASTIDGLMANCTLWPVSLTDMKGPNEWMMASHLTTDRALSYLWHYRSTLSLMTSIQPCNYTPEIARQDFAPENLLTASRGLMKDAFGIVCSSHQSVLYHTLEHQLMTDSERAGAVTRKTLDSSLWADDVDIEERGDYSWPVGIVKADGVYYPGSEAEVVTFFSEAPGDAPKVFGREEGMSGLILSAQADLNVRCGRMLGRRTLRYPTMRARFFNDGSFGLVPQDVFPLTIEPADNYRALDWEPTALVKRVNRRFDNEQGLISYEVEFEPIATGTASGATVDMPSEPPEAERPTWDPPPPTPWTPPANPIAEAAVAADATVGHFWTPNGGTSWDERNAGLETTQLAFRDLIWDPWWRVKTGGHNPAQAILLGCGVGFVAVSDDAGQNWQDMTPNFSDPPNTWGDATGAVATDLTYIQLHGDIHNRDVFYGLAEWESTGSLWRGWLFRTDDNFVTMAWTSLTSAPSGYTPGATYTFDFATDGQQEWAANTAWIAGAHDDPTFEYAASPCDNADQWFQDDRLAVGAPGTPDYEKRIPIFYPYRLTFTQSTIEFRRPAEALLAEYGRYRLYTSPDLITWTQVGTVNGTRGGTQICETLTLNTYVTGSYVMVHHNTYGTLTTPDDAILTSVQFVDLTIEGGVLSSVRPIRMDLDTQAGTRLYVTVWQDSALRAQTWNVPGMTLARAAGFGGASMAQMNARTYWIAPHCPHQAGTTGFGDHVYVFGRFDATGTSRLAYSTNALGSSLTIDEATWGTGASTWIGALETPVELEVLAFLNAGAPANLWRTTDHSAWAALSNLPFDVDPAGVSRHWGATSDILISNRGATPATGSAAAQQPDPYTGAWIASDGAVLPKAADGGTGLPAIIWV